MPGTLEPAVLEEVIARGDTYTLVFELFLVAANAVDPDAPTDAEMTPDDLTGRTFRATARHPLTDAVLRALATGDGITTGVGENGSVANRVTLTFPLTDTAGFPVDAIKWDWEETNGTDRQTLVLGTTTVKEDQSR